MMLDVRCGLFGEIVETSVNKLIQNEDACCTQLVFIKIPSIEHLIA